MSTPAKIGSTFGIPILTTTERNAVTPADGMLLYNNTIGRRETRNNGTWMRDLYLVQFNTSVGSYTMTNQLLAEERFVGGVQLTKSKHDLSQYTQFRFIAYCINNGTAGSIIYLKYSTDDSTFSDISSSPQTLSLAVQTVWKDTGWVDMVSGAKAADIYLSPFSSGGNGTSDPAVASIYAMFR